jgi:hypothetical protein
MIVSCQKNFGATRFGTRQMQRIDGMKSHSCQSMRTFYNLFLKRNESTCCPSQHPHSDAPLKITRLLNLEI